ncbi:DUF5683 domain-containing protein [Belliella sp. R4-6]|uniref:DUF5683 domain-containing protein n=1 Tax=Belliella alkalica TaxID=1730871 RepID=A0ABS9V7F3_9BACT|nr:DUF5683 domain-containing protein [Belliella alkalica]MCH7412353.1 DUF5683 domain-containing protein [Belliella alkalica]
MSKKCLAMVFRKTIAVFVLLAIYLTPSFAQSNGETVTIEINEKLPKDPKVATLLSAILPGAGQVYNEKVWKLPIIYGGFATNLYFIDFNNRRYQLFREELGKFDDGAPNLNFPNMNRDALARNVDFWRRNRDLNFVVFGLIYILNIVDAQVDAHLSGFDISDDISLICEPSYESLYAGGGLVGVSLKLKF